VLRYHPAGVEHRLSEPAILYTALALLDAGSASGGCGLGLRGMRARPPGPLTFRATQCIRFRYGPVTRSHPYDDPSMGFRSFVSLLPAIQATKLRAVTLAGLSPAERASLR
jgi:hypothetical protein